MPAPAMFSKFKHVGSAPPIQSALESNPIIQFFEIGKQVASAGPELVWKIHDAYRKSDGKVSNVSPLTIQPSAKVLLPLIGFSFHQIANVKRNPVPTVK